MEQLDPKCCKCGCFSKNPMQLYAGRLPTTSICTKAREHLHVVANHILRKAIDAFNRLLYSRALKHYVDYFELEDSPSRMKNCEANFVECVLYMMTYSNRNVEYDLKIILHANNLFPGNTRLLILLGDFLFKCGEINISKVYYEKVLTYDKNNLRAEKSLLHLSWHLIPRWHFRMLNNSLRNLAYRKAIHNALSDEFNNVIDIGSGCALLSMYAAIHPSKPFIRAFEENKTLYEMSRDIIKGNNFLHTINLININTNSIEIHENDANVLITEIFDVGVFGEGFLESIVHAHEFLLTSDRPFKIIPCKVKIYVTGIEAPRNFLKKHKVTNTIPELRIENVCISCHNKEPYEAEDLSTKNVTYLTDTVEFLTMDLYNVQQLRDLLDWKTTVKLNCTKKGKLEALVVWFDLWLDDATCITTNPRKQHASCWEQAIYFLNHICEVNENEQIEVEAKVHTDLLNMTVTSPVAECGICFTLSQNAIYMLNDTNYVRKVAALARRFIPKDGVIIDFNAFPLLGLLLAKKGYTCYHIAEDRRNLSFIFVLLRRNKIEANKFVFLHAKEQWQFLPGLGTIDVIFFDTVNVDGSLKEIFHQHLFERWNPQIFPYKISIFLVLVESQYLDHSNKVDDKNVEPFKIAQYMNVYTGTEHPYIDMLNQKLLSEFGECPVSNSYHQDHMVTLSVLDPGNINGIYFWYKLHFTEDIGYNTIEGSAFHKTCILVDPPKPVKVGNKIKIRILREGSTVKFTCL